MPSLKGRDLISTQDWTTEEIVHLLRIAADLKGRLQKGETLPLLAQQLIAAVWFDRPRLTRKILEAAAVQLGAGLLSFDADEPPLTPHSSPREVAELVGRIAHVVTIRHALALDGAQKFMRDAARMAAPPVINLGCDLDHPIHALADLLTLREVFGQDLRGRKLVVAWEHAPFLDRASGLPQALASLLTRFDMDVFITHPPEYALPERCLKIARTSARERGTRFEVVGDLDAALHQADAVYGLSWESPDLLTRRRAAADDEQTHDAEEQLASLAARSRHWRCDEARMKRAKVKAVYMTSFPPPRPDYRDDPVFAGTHSVVFHQTENRLHVARALLAAVLLDRPLREY